MLILVIPPLMAVTTAEQTATAGELLGTKGIAITAVLLQII